MTKIRTLADCPEWQAAEKKLVDWQEEFAAVDQELARLAAHRASENDRDVFQDAAQAMLAGGDYEIPAAGNDDQERELRFRRKALRLVLDQHKTDMEALRRKLSMDLCNEVRPEYGKLVKEMATASEKLLAVIGKEKALREGMNEGGVAVDYLNICHPSATGRLEIFLNNARELGYI